MAAFFPFIKHNTERPSHKRSIQTKATKIWIVRLNQLSLQQTTFLYTFKIKKSLVKWLEIISGVSKIFEYGDWP